MHSHLGFLKLAGDSLCFQVGRCFPEQGWKLCSTVCTKLPLNQHVAGDDPGLFSKCLAGAAEAEYWISGRSLQGQPSQARAAFMVAGLGCAGWGCRQGQQHIQNQAEGRDLGWGWARTASHCENHSISMLHP